MQFQEIRSLAALMVWLCFAVVATRPVFASTTILGAKGLVTAPTARMSKPGQIWVGGSYHDPYAHYFTGFQLSNAVAVTLRQSAQSNNPADRPKGFFPGVDAKWRLKEETRSRPQTALGWQSASGHKRMGGEYFTASKRFYNWDFTAGLGWGRYANGLTMDNPLRFFGGHFDNPRHIDGHLPIQPEHWFTGTDVGLFAGAEYQTTLQGLSLKFDIGADHYAAEKNSASDDDYPLPWAAGANYHLPLSHTAGIDTQMAIHGGGRASLRIALTESLGSWFSAPRIKAVTPIRAKRLDRDQPADQTAISAARENILLSSVHKNTATATSVADMHVKPHYSLPDQMGRAFVHMANEAAPFIEKLTVRPRILGLQASQISVQRQDIEKAHQNQGSASEIWRNTEIKPAVTGGDFQKQQRSAEIQSGFLPFKLTLSHQNSLAEEDYGILHRTALVADVFLPRKTGYFDYGLSMRLNLKDNLHHIATLRQKATLPVRSDIANFTQDLIGLDRAFIAFTHTVWPDTHIALSAGFLEEMYAGLSGEVLYRPFMSRIALGVEGALALKRHPDTTLHSDLTGDRVLTGQVNAYYDWPYEDLTLSAHVGRFLNQDMGARIGMQRGFKNGASLSAYVALSDTADPDIYGGTTHADYGVRLNLPLGGLKHLPDYLYADVTSAPFGRDIAQSLDKPIDLYRLTQPISMAHMLRHWGDVAP